MTAQKRALVLFSGGQDSTTCLYWAIQRFEEVRALGFDYGQRHRVEIEQAKTIAEMAGISCEVFECHWPVGRLGTDGPGARGGCRAPEGGESAGDVCSRTEPAFSLDRRQLRLQPRNLRLGGGDESDRLFGLPRLSAGVRRESGDDAFAGDGPARLSSAYAADVFGQGRTFSSWRKIWAYWRLSWSIRTRTITVTVPSVESGDMAGLTMRPAGCGPPVGRNTSADARKEKTDKKKDRFSDQTKKF